MFHRDYTIKLTLFLDGEEFQSWELQMPKFNSNYSALENFERRKRTVDDKIAWAKIEHHDHIIRCKEHRFELSKRSAMPLWNERNRDSQNFKDRFLYHLNRRQKLLPYKINQNVIL